MLERDGESSNIVQWEVHNELVSDHDRNHAVVTEYLRNGPRRNSREAAEALRPILEAFLRVAYPEQFPAGPQSMRRFRNICREAAGTNAEILSRAEVQELESLIEYANLFHHNTNPGVQDVIVNDAELQGFAQRTLRFATKTPL
jgi:hypothetical protein